MDDFIDTCILLTLIDEKHKFHKSSKEFCQNNNNMIMCFYQSTSEIPYLLMRLKLTARITKIKAISPMKEIPEIEKLLKKDRIKIKKMLADYELGLLTIEDIFKLQEQAYLLERKINNFLKTRIKRLVVSIKDIDENLVDFLSNLTKNTADSNIGASAIQEHQENKLILITNDQSDFKRDYFFKVSNGTKYKQVPEIKYLK